jgi:hypothetical protein
MESKSPSIICVGLKLPIPTQRPEGFLGYVLLFWLYDVYYIEKIIFTKKYSIAK